MRPTYYKLGLLFSSILYAKVIPYELILEESTLNSTLFPISKFIINKQFPGPLIECEAGDTLIINVKNQLKRNITIHWHGITQRNSCPMDGVPYISQTPILPNASFKYKLNINDQTGTYWYHAHTGLDAEYIFGPLIIYDKPEIWTDIINFNPEYAYDEERTILLSELWKKDQEEIIHDLTHVPFSQIPSSNWVLINGKTNKEPFIFNVKPLKRYRIRVIGSNGLSLLTLRIPNHKFTIIEVDGTLVDPIQVDHLQINAGQRYSLIIETDQKPADYSILVQVIYPENLSPPFGLAKLSYQNKFDNHFVNLKPFPQSMDKWITLQLKTSQWYLKGKNDHYYLPPEEVDQDLVFNVEFKDFEGLSVFKINNQLLRPKDFPGLLDSKNPPGVYKLTLGQRVQFVFQHILRPGHGCFQHPWHLHGHSFHIVDRGPGIYNSTIDLPKINKKISNRTTLPIFRDTFTQFPHHLPENSNLKNCDHSISKKVNHLSSKKCKCIPKPTNVKEDPPSGSCGWTAIRFIADNPGNWIMHCHITAHIIMGKVFVIQTAA